MPHPGHRTVKKGPTAYLPLAPVGTVSQLLLPCLSLAIRDELPASRIAFDLLAKAVVADS
jgi:hypothetical protein